VSISADDVLMPNTSSSTTSKAGKKSNKRGSGIKATSRSRGGSKAGSSSGNSGSVSVSESLVLPDVSAPLVGNLTLGLREKAHLLEKRNT
jgi:hypothetical protein